MIQHTTCKRCGQVTERKIAEFKGNNRMTINDFAVQVSKKEGKKVQLSIAQISEVLKVVNQLLDGKLYREIRKSCTA